MPLAVRVPPQHLWCLRSPDHNRRSRVRPSRYLMSACITVHACTNNASFLSRNIAAHAPPVCMCPAQATPARMCSTLCARPYNRCVYSTRIQTGILAMCARRDYQRAIRTCVTVRICPKPPALFSLAECGWLQGGPSHARVRQSRRPEQRICSVGGTATLSPLRYKPTCHQSGQPSPT